MTFNYKKYVENNPLLMEEIMEGTEEVSENQLPEGTDLEPMFMEMLEAYNNYIFEEYGNNPGKLDNDDAKEFIRQMNFSDHEFMLYVGN